ncbi:MAG: imidazolonepropionase [Chlorobi bacterium]|nr:imidazolonepropionase [Chlorobiota bacterium]MCI0715245.1 imidazolonepropionase [Chlorobiota bacterium]
MNLLIENARQIITCHSRGYRFKAGKFQSEIGLIENSSIYIENGRIKWLGKKIPQFVIKSNFRKIDAGSKIVLPGFIDSHTHLVFAGDRANEFSMRIKGKSYEEIANAGGGIISTVKAVRKTSKKGLLKLAKERLNSSISFGVTTIEAKSGYGLDTENEIKMLEVINELNQQSPIDVYATFLGAHAFPKNKTKEEYIDEILFSMIPLAAKRNLATFIDVFCEKNYFSADETVKIFMQGINFGLVPKLHTNQFNSIGGIEAAVNYDAISVDHLEVMTEKDIGSLKGGGSIACLLPSVSYFLDIPYAPAKKLTENRIPVALATDFNPGSAMSENIQLVMSLAVQKLKMNIEETINAVTLNAAAALGISHNVGSIETGKQGDLLIFDVPDYKHLLYHFGVNTLNTVIKKGKIIMKL